MADAQGRDRGLPQARGHHARVGHHSPAMPSMRAAERAQVVEGASAPSCSPKAITATTGSPTTPLDNWRSRAAGNQGRRHDRHGHPHARRFSEFLVGPMERVARSRSARVLPFDDWRHHAGDARVPQRRHRHDRHLAEDAVSCGASRSMARDCWAESVSETRPIVPPRRTGARSDRSAANESISAATRRLRRAALEQRPFPIDHAGILQTVGALEAVFNRQTPAASG